MKSARYWIRRLQLIPHPEGGFYREVYRSDEGVGGKALPARYNGPRAFSTSIYYLLRSQDVSRFHRIASDEIWHFYAGSPLTLHVIDPQGCYQAVHLGVEGHRRQQPQQVITRGDWFAATVDNPRQYTLMGCTVAPGFDFADFELADQDTLVALCPTKSSLIKRLT
ncbi:MAG: cupin domain-containing protein [bacterium]